MFVNRVLQQFKIQLQIKDLEGKKDKGGLNSIPSYDDNYADFYWKVIDGRILPEF